MRIQILNPGNEHVKQGREEGRLALIDGPTFIGYLETPFVCTPIGVRPKGLRVSKTDPNNITEYYDLTVIKRIKEHNSHTKTDFLYWGPEFTVVFDSDKQATFYLCTSTLREFAYEFKNNIDKTVAINLTKIDTGNFHFYLPVM